MHKLPKDNYIIFDYETTGFDPLKGDEVIQMSAVKYKQGERVGELNLYIDTLVDLDPKITELTGITPEKLASDGIAEADAWNQFHEFIEDLPLIGHNSINFDRRFLEYFFKRYNFELPGKDRHFDTGMIYKGKVANVKLLPNESHFDYCVRVGEMRLPIKWRLTLCCDELNIDRSNLEAHRSDSDVEMTHLLYKKFLAENDPVLSVEEMYNNRIKEITKYGLKYDLKNAFVFENGQTYINVDIVDIKTYEEAKWQNLILQIERLTAGVENQFVVNTVKRTVKTVDEETLKKRAKEEEQLSTEVKVLRQRAEKEDELKYKLLVNIETGEAIDIDDDDHKVSEALKAVGRKIKELQAIDTELKKLAVMRVSDDQEKFDDYWDIRRRDGFTFFSKEDEKAYKKAVKSLEKKKKELIKPIDNELKERKKDFGEVKTTTYLQFPRLS